MKWYTCAQRITVWVWEKKQGAVPINCVLCVVPRLARHGLLQKPGTGLGSHGKDSVSPWVIVRYANCGVLFASLSFFMSVSINVINVDI